MARLITFPDGLWQTSVTWTNGPNVRNSGSNTAQDGSEQTFEGIGDLVSLQLDMQPIQGQPARRERGTLTALMGGANAMRWTFVDADRMSLEEAGLEPPFQQQPWSNGLRWTSKRGWRPAPPIVHLAAPAAVGDGIISLTDEWWGWELGLGDYIGFFPFHFGLYMITEVQGLGVYRIWPRLRKAVTPNDYASLTATLVMRPTSRDAYNLKRDAATTSGQSVSLVEVLDNYARDYFAGGSPLNFPPST
jgi:hypothetical protein